MRVVVYNVCIIKILQDGGFEVGEAAYEVVVDGLSSFVRRGFSGVGMPAGSASPTAVPSGVEERPAVSVTGKASSPSSSSSFIISSAYTSG